MNIKIIGTGSCVPEQKISNNDFLNHAFLNEKGSPLGYNNEVIIKKFKSITGIENRRYANDNQTASDLGLIAAKRAIENAKIDPEKIDYIIVAHNFGDVTKNSIQGDMLPSLATRVKNKLGIKNPKCVAFDTIFGCPGWIEGIIQANAYIKAAMAKTCLVIGADTLSRIVDDHDRDTMIYSDGAGAAIIEACEDNDGLLAYEHATYALDEANYLFFGKTYNQDLNSNTKYIKMHGRKIYEFALTNVPSAMKECLDKSGISIDDVKKILIHQANEKMDEAIIDRFYKLYDKTAPKDIMPMCIHELGNSSVATVPTLYDLLIKGEIKDHSISKGDVLIFASVGAGMNINAFVYRH